ncbi:MAG TPA: hypothetical protein DEB39_08630 [Planctomycetaceae bacterium]|nr:hypothetical protein [Planctomycetaceae bacterium]
MRKNEENSQISLHEDRIMPDTKAGIVITVLPITKGEPFSKTCMATHLRATHFTATHFAVPCGTTVLKHCTLKYCTLKHCTLECCTWKHRVLKHRASPNVDDGPKGLHGCRSLRIFM